MIRNCILYRVEAAESMATSAEKIPRRTTLESLVERLPDADKKKLKTIAGKCKGGVLSVRGESTHFLLLTFRCEVEVRRLTASGEKRMPYVPVEFQVWFGKTLPWAVSFDAGRRLSDVVMAMIGLLALDDISGLKPAQFDKEVFGKLVDWARTSSASKTWAISRVTLHEVTGGGYDFKQIVLRANGLEKATLYNEFFERAARILNLTFATPKLRAASRPIRCKLSFWGGITLYTAQTLESEVEELITVIASFVGPQ